MKVDLSEFRSAYLAEVDEHLSAADARLVEIAAALRDGRSAPRETRDLMRLLHTIKGLSAMVGIDPIVVIAHKLETLLRQVDRGERTLTEDALEALIAGKKAIDVRVHAVAASEKVAPAPESLLAQIETGEETREVRVTPPMPFDPELAAKLGLVEQQQIREALAGGRRVVRIDFAPSPAKSEAGDTITSVRQRLANVVEIVKVVPIGVPASDAIPGGLLFAIVAHTSATDDAIAAAARVPTTDVRPLAVPSDTPEEEEGARDVAVAPMDDAEFLPQRGVLRVEVGRVDDAIEKLSALVVTRSRLGRGLVALAAAGAPTRELEAVVADLGRQLRDLRASLLRVRMVPIVSVLDRLPLVVRGLARATGKRVRLVVDGAAAELDKSIAEQIFPALVHLLRNAVDHGIEMPQDRARAGKPEEGTITIQCASQANRYVEIVIADDGSGVDRRAVAAKTGIDAHDDAALLDLLTRPGLSTRDRIDTTSGRGFGMDIVKRTVVDTLGGELLLQTERGHGTTFTLRVPLTITIADAFTLRCGGERFVVPVSGVEEIVELDPKTIVEGPRVRGRSTRMFARRGETVSLVDLAAMLGLTPQPDARHALVVRRGKTDPVAFAVERVVGQQETVVRPLDDALLAAPGVTGSTDLGDGRATLVLDLAGLSSRLASEERAA